MFTLMIYFRYK